MFKSFFYKYYFVAICLSLLAYTAKVNWSNGQWQNILEADAKGYYAYLPATFIYDDLNFGFYQKVEVENAYDPNLSYDYRYTVNGKTVNKYFIGVAVLLTPFFLIGHCCTYIFGHSPDGYSQIYMIFVTLGALFYALLGLFYLRKLLRLFKIDELAIFWTLVATIFGTNLFYYIVGEPGMSHVYSFAMISVFLYHATNFFKKNHANSIFFAAIAFGIILILRPVNGIIIGVVPFLAGDATLFVTRIKGLKTNYLKIVFSMVFILAILAIQSLVYYTQTGSLWVYSYGHETFDFSSFHLGDFLWSYKKGFFLYTPMALLCFIGLLFVNQSKFFKVGVFIFLIGVMYLLSSWWMWFYGGSFSSRVMIEYLPIFALVLGLWLHNIKLNLKKRALIALIVIFVLINQIQILQYRYYIIHWSDMNKELYWDTFLDISPIIKRK